MRALVVVDYQRDFVDGSLGSENSVAIEDALAKRVEKALADGEDVYFTRDSHGPEYKGSNEGRHIPVAHCVKGTDGWEIYGKLRELSKKCTVIDKGTFGSDELYGIMKRKGYERVEICGVATNICVIVNAALIRTALPNADVVVDPKLVASYDGRLGKEALEVMQGFCIDVLPERGASTFI